MLLLSSTDVRPFQGPFSGATGAPRASGSGEGLWLGANQATMAVVRRRYVATEETHSEGVGT